MSEINTIDVSHIKFTSSACPSDEDLRLWDSLSDEQQHAIIERDLDAAQESGIAPQRSMAEIIAEARDEMRHEG
ncbi:MAG: hypothetical protein ACSHYC_22025 [Alphaproteobacteria bacterium]